MLFLFPLISDFNLTCLLIFGDGEDWTHASCSSSVRFHVLLKGGAVGHHACTVTWRSDVSGMLWVSATWVSGNTAGGVHILPFKKEKRLDLRVGWASTVPVIFHSVLPGSRVWDSIPSGRTLASRFRYEAFQPSPPRRKPRIHAGWVFNGCSQYSR